MPLTYISTLQIVNSHMQLLTDLSTTETRRCYKGPVICSQQNVTLGWRDG